MMYYINSISRLFFPVRFEDWMVKYNPVTGAIITKQPNKETVNEPSVPFIFLMKIIRDMRTHEIYSNLESGELILYYTDRKKPITII